MANTPAQSVISISDGETLGYLGPAHGYQCGDRATDLVQTGRMDELLMFDYYQRAIYAGQGVAHDPQNVAFWRAANPTKWKWVDPT